MDLLIIGGSDAGISAALRARECTSSARVPVLVADSITGDRKTHQLLGAQIVGSSGAEVSKRIDVFSAALFNGMMVEELDQLDLSYTPPLGSPWDPVQLAAHAWTKEQKFSKS